MGEETPAPPRHHLVAWLSTARALAGRLAIITAIAGAINPANAEEERGRIPVASDWRISHYDDFRPFVGVPEPPSYVAMDVAGEQVTRPLRGRPGAAHLLIGVDPTGTQQTGIGFDLVPWFLYNAVIDDPTPIEAYRSYWVRALRRLRISPGAVKASSNGERALRFAFAFDTTLFDGGDPLLDENLELCLLDPIQGDSARRSYDQAQTLRQQGLPATLADVAEKQAAHVLETARLDCFKDFSRRSWNANFFSVGVAPVLLSPNGEVTDTDWGYVSTWTTGALQIGDRGQIVGTVRYSPTQKFVDPDDSRDFVRQDKLVAGLQGRMRLIPFDAWGEEASPVAQIFAEFDYLYTNRNDASADSSFRIAGGVEARVLGSYLTVTFGGSGGADDSGQQAFILASLRYGF